MNYIEIHYRGGISGEIFLDKFSGNKNFCFIFLPGISGGKNQKIRFSIPFKLDRI